MGATTPRTAARVVAVHWGWFVATPMDGARTLVTTIWSTRQSGVHAKTGCATGVTETVAPPTHCGRLGPSNAAQAVAPITASASGLTRMAGACMAIIYTAEGSARAQGYLCSRHLRSCCTDATGAGASAWPPHVDVPSSASLR